MPLQLSAGVWRNKFPYRGLKTNQKRKNRYKAAASYTVKSRRTAGFYLNSLVMPICF